MIAVVGKNESETVEIKTESSPKLREDWINRQDIFQFPIYHDRSYI